jgi:hypothetical protein
MDDDLAARGVVGRDGKVRELAKQRMRADAKLRIALHDYAASARAVENTEQHTAEPGGAVSAASSSLQDLSAQIAHEHGQASIAMVTPVLFDARSFLTALAVTADPAVGDDVKMAAARLCTPLVRREHSRHCVCMATWSAHDETEFRDWIAEARDVGLRSDEDDVGLAALVREYGRGAAPRISPSTPRSGERWTKSSHSSWLGPAGRRMNGSERTGGLRRPRGII